MCLHFIKIQYKIDNVKFLVYRVNPDIVRLGSQNLKFWDSRSAPTDISIEKILAHPDYKRSTHYNDIALIQLARKVQ